MRNRLSVPAVLLLASVAIIPATAQNRPAMPPLTAADTNRIIPVRVGHVLIVDLRQSAGTGSNWRMVPAAGLIQVGPAIVMPVPRDGPAIVGGAVTHVFRVRVTAPGELALTFVNAATFGGADQKAETATFVMNAK